MPTGAGGMALRKALSRVPVTALCFYEVAGDEDVLVLAGEDTRVLAYRTGAGAEAAADGGGDGNGDASPVWEADVFSDQPVHGLHVWHEQHQFGAERRRARVLVWGSSSLAVLELTTAQEGIPPRVLARGTAPDWIYDGAISPWDGDRAAIVTAHNEVVPLTITSDGDGGDDDGRAGRITFGAATSPSRPMLYSARLTWVTARCVLATAGTVFGDVVVWKCCLPANIHAQASHSTVCKLTGHEGSIYGVDISPLLTLADGSTMRLLATCSDDRTIRIWDITDRQQEDSLASGTESGSLEVTGFKPAGGSGVSDNNDSRLVAVAMGHASRIWGVRMGLQRLPAALRDDQAVSVYSFGEDATAQRWRLELPQRGVAGRLTHERTMSLHGGKHLWAGAVLCQPRRTLIATGGGDSRVCLVEEPVADGEEEKDEGGLGRGNITTGGPSDGLVTVDVQGVLDSLSSSGSSRAGRELISRYDFLSNEEILVSTSLGRLFIGSLTRSMSWEEVIVEDDMVDDLRLTYTLRAVGDGAAVIGTTTGKLFYYHRSRRLTRIVQVPGKVHEVGIIASNEQDSVAGASLLVQLMVYLHGNSESHYLTLDRDPGSLVRHEKTAGLDARFTPVSAARLGDLLLMGSRRGWLSLLTKQGDAWRSILDLPPRSNDAITAIVPLPPKDGSDSPSPYFLTTSRDGKFRIFHIESAQDTTRCRMVHETSPPFGPMIEGAWFTRDAVPELILYGFRSVDFVVWNETRREEVATVECGGAHRTFRLWYGASDPLRYRLAFTRSSKLSVYSQAKLAFRTLKPGTHGREIRALCSNKRYVATGAEDTSIQIWRTASKKDSRVQLRHMASIKAHVSGIQKLRWLGEEYLLSSGGNEEFFIWRIRTLGSSYAGLAVVCEAIFEDKTEIGDLRVMDFDVDDKAVPDGFLVTLAFSNSTFRTFHYRPGTEFKPIAQGHYTGACLTQVRHLGICRGTSWLVTASTDGHLALWKMQGQCDSQQSYKMTQTTRIHQSSIKGLDMARTQTSFRFLTGGDDNALGVTLVGLAKNTHDYTFLQRSIVRSAHAAAINGVLLLGREGDDDMHGVSVSNDQRVRLWRIRGEDASRVELLGCFCSGVADPGDVAQIWAETGDCHIMLGGVGVEAWRCDDAR